MMFYYTLGCGVVGLAGVWQHRVFFEIPVTALTACKASDTVSKALLISTRLHLVLQSCYL
jgi:hypothetical protein